jgi:predicted GIY-YIG superfamily endonuclease
MAWVYILKCSDASYYTGSTVDLDKRIAEHQDGTYGGWTAHRRPVELVFSHEVPTKNEAFVLEHQIKGWSRAKKEALIAGDFELLRTLARRRSRVAAND